ncbi:hypothetical protein HYW54_04425 [Candidatus Gottesmanbacteria bacterium]|nr:hypothetical protein [Candidatus Gottesmanbacteria bacterium]
MTKKYLLGQSLVELLLAMGLAAILLPALLTGLISSREGKAQQNQRVEAVSLLNEAVEATRSVKEKGWGNIATSGLFHPEIDPLDSSWLLVAAEESISNFTRSISISDVYRDQSGNIVTTGGTLDPSTKKATITVSWASPLPSQISSTLYLARLDNLSLVHTTQEDFNSGILSGTTVRETDPSPEQIPDDGEIVLSAGGGGDWCAPLTSIVEELDLPKSGKATAVTAIEGEAYAGTGENSAGESLADINITNTNPPIASLIETVDGYKTNDIFGEDDYAYIATDKNSEEAAIFDISQIPFTWVGKMNPPVNENGESIFVSGNTGYLVVKRKLWNYDLTSKVGDRPEIDTDGVDLAGEGRSVYVVGGYAYVAIEGNNNVQLQIIDVATNQSNMTVVGQADINNQHGQDVYVNQTGTRAYIVTNATSPEEKEFHIVDTTNKTNPVKIGPGYYTNGMSPEGIEVVPGGRAIIVGRGGEEYQVVDITDENSPVRCGGMDVDSGIFDSASILESDGDAYTYIVSGDADSEFKIIQGGPGGQFNTSGTFESSIIDRSAEPYKTAFNRIIASVNEPTNTDIKLQVAVAEAIDNSCSNITFDYAGPDGNSDTFFEFSNNLIAGPIPYSSGQSGYKNPGECFRYKAFFETTDSGTTPIIYDVTINYSP